MNPMTQAFHWSALSLATAVLLTACGGGGGDTGSASAPQPIAMYAGPITGFGSVIVNGVRFSSVGAELVDDDGLVKNLDQLKLGMTLRVSGEADDNSQLGTASQLELVHGTRGTITTVNVTAGTLTLLGQTVVTNSATAYQGVSGLAGLTVGQPIEVYGVLQADGSLLATLIEVKPALTSVRLSGRMSGLSATTFQVGSLIVNYSTATVTGVLGEGKRVKIKAATGPVGNVLTASSVHVSEASSVYGATVTTGALLKLKGVADAAPVNGLLNVSGTPVNMAQAVIRGGTAIAAGQFIEVKGTWDGSVLQATEVVLEGWRAGQMGGHNELYGAVSSVDSSVLGKKIVVVNGVTVEMNSSTVFEHGSLDQVTVGSYVEIKGNLVGSTLLATKVELKNTGRATGVSYEQHGPISGFVSASSFTLNGLTVDATGARFQHGSMNSLANGIYVGVKGTQNSSGVFVASKVEIKTH